MDVDTVQFCWREGYSESVVSGFLKTGLFCGQGHLTTMQARPFQSCGVTIYILSLYEESIRLVIVQHKLIDCNVLLIRMIF